MSFLTEVFVDALGLLFPPSLEIWLIVILSLSITLFALLLALLIGVPLGALLALRIFPGKKQTETLVRGSMGFPPVLIGLLMSLLLWPQAGPLGFLGLLHTPLALIFTQTLIILPIIIGFTMTGMQQIDPNLVLQFRALGASPSQLLKLLLWEIRTILVGAVLVSSGRILSEVGASLMIGGNIPNHTRLLSTAITMETTQGNLELAVALGLALLLLTILLGTLLAFSQKRRTTHEYSH